MCVPTSRVIVHTESTGPQVGRIDAQPKKLIDTFDNRSIVNMPI